MNDTKRNNLKKMFSKYSYTIRPHTVKTYAQLEAEGKKAAARVEWVNKNALQMSGHEYNHMMHNAVQNLKILRCAWTAKVNGW